MEAVGEDGEDVIDIDIQVGSGGGARVKVDDIDIFANAIIDVLFYITNDDR